MGSDGTQEATGSRATPLSKSCGTPGVTAGDHVPSSVRGPAAAGDTAATFPPASRVGQPRTTRETTKPGRAAQKGRVVTLRGSQAQGRGLPKHPSGRHPTHPPSPLPAGKLRDPPGLSRPPASGARKRPHIAGERASRRAGSSGPAVASASGRKLERSLGRGGAGRTRAGGLTAAQRRPRSAAAAMAQPTGAEARAREASGSPVTAARSLAAPRLRRSERICSCGSSQHSPPRKNPRQAGRAGRGGAWRASGRG